MKWIKPSEINGTLPAPSSKSMMIRACAAALMAEGKSWIRHPSFCDDTLATLEIIQALGAHIENKKDGDGIYISGGKNIRNSTLNCRESGLNMRLFAPIASLNKAKIFLSAAGSLKTRPMDMLEGPLRSLGATCQTLSGFPPVQVQGPIKGGRISIDGSLSSQVLTGLMMALPLCTSDSEIDVHNLKSRPYAAMTHSVLEEFGVSIIQEQNFNRIFIKGFQKYRPTTYTVEGDWSAAAFLLVAGAVSGQITLTNLNPDSLQGDKKIIDALRLSGADVTLEKKSIFVQNNRLNAFEFDATACPDLFPPLAVLATSCRGISHLKGIERLKHKESNRALALEQELKKIGAKIKIRGNTMDIEGTPLEGGLIHSHGDHRIAMAGAVAALQSRKGVRIQDWQAVSKSYPDFFDNLESIQGGSP